MPHKPFHRKNVKKKSTVTSVSDLKKKSAENKRKKIEDKKLKKIELAKKKRVDREKEITENTAKKLTKQKRKASKLGAKIKAKIEKLKEGGITEKEKVQIEKLKERSSNKTKRIVKKADSIRDDARNKSYKADTKMSLRKRRAKRSANRKKRSMAQTGLKRWDGTWN